MLDLYTLCAVCVMFSWDLAEDCGRNTSIPFLYLYQVSLSRQINLCHNLSIMYSAHRKYVDASENANIFISIDSVKFF